MKGVVVVVQVVGVRMEVVVVQEEAVGGGFTGEKAA